MDIRVKDRIIGWNEPTFIIAELSANHVQNYDVAVKSVEAAKESGADAIKLQTYTPDTLTIDCDNKYFQIRQGTLWDGKTLHQLYQEAYTPWDWQPKLKERAEELGLVCFSTPFDRTAVDFLEDMKVSLYKVASFEIRDIPLIQYMASKGKPMIMSTGMAAFSDIEEAVLACKGSGNNQIALLKCTSSYPAPLDEVNLRTIPVGLSDHTMGTSVPAAAVAMGARIIEKHFTVDRRLGGPDATFSLEPHEFAAMVQAVRDVEKALGVVCYELSPSAARNQIFSRSLFVVKDMKEGEEFTEENVRSIRPGFGLHPKYFGEILGKVAGRDIERGTPLTWDLAK
jgi:pseudaminic acid synthase